MVNFIKLTSIVINSSKINKIDITHNKYFIHLINNKIDGFFLFTSGYIDARNDIIEICREKHPIDYNILTEWINKNN